MASSAAATALAGPVVDGMKWGMVERALWANRLGAPTRRAMARFCSGCRAGGLAVPERRRDGAGEGVHAGGHPVARPFDFDTAAHFGDDRHGRGLVKLL